MPKWIASDLTESSRVEKRIRNIDVAADVTHLDFRLSPVDFVLDPRAAGNLHPINIGELRVHAFDYRVGHIIELALNW